MKERPILMSGPMVRAILAGTKTQTRRTLHPRLNGSHPGIIPCHLGSPGDRLWVRETWGGDGLSGYVYRADHPDADLARGDLDDGEQSIRRWRPAIHMRRSVSRIDLEILSVRVERLQDITEEDARAEGVVPLQMDAGSCLPRFEGLWDVINGKRAPWSSNPWVWRIEFRKLGADVRGGGVSDG